MSPSNIIEMSNILPVDAIIMETDQERRNG
jgi:hypothetical protein